jgi:ABC-2 type transport system permease protein
MSKSAKRTFADLKVFGRGYIRNGAALFFGIIFPVILIVLFGAIFAGSGGQSVVYVQNHDSGPISTQYIMALNGTNVNQSWPITVQTVDPAENFTTFLLAKSGNAAADGVLIPADFTAHYFQGIPVNVTIYGNPTQTSSQILNQVVAGITNAFNLRYYNGTVPVITTTTQTLNTQQTKYIDSLIPGLIGFSILVSPMFAMVNITSEYKKTKLFKQLSLTPLHKMEWLASKVIWYIILSVISFVLLVAVGVYGFGAHITLTPWLIPFLILGPMLFASLGMLVGTISKSVESASVLGNIITFPMMFLSGTFFPLSQMPAYLQSFAHILPLFYVVEGLNNVMVFGNFTAALLDIAILGIITAVFFVAAAKLFKWRED